TAFSYQESIVYSCTMHPEVQSSKPGKCPKCKMKLVAERPAEKTTDNAAPQSQAGNRRRVQSEIRVLAEVSKTQREDPAAIRYLQSQNRRAGERVLRDSREAVSSVHRQPGPQRVPAHSSGARTRRQLHDRDRAPACGQLQNLFRHLSQRRRASGLATKSD